MMGIDSPSKVNKCGIAGLTCLRLKLTSAAGRACLTPELINSLVEALEYGQQARLVVIEGMPGSFCEGLDLERLAYQSGKEAHTAGSEAILTQYAALLAVIGRTPCPVVALVDGAAFGGGVGLAAAADLVLASKRASFALSETLMGLIPATVFPIIARRIGMPRTRLLALGIEPLSASKAFQFGLVDEITDDLEDRLAAFARRFSRMDAHAVGVMKSLISTYFTDHSEYQADAAARFYELLESETAHVRLTRFLNGEAPWLEDETQ